jgi:thioredoxin-like negative regulator of GroEL
VNTDEEQELAGAFQIRSIPTLMVFRDKVLLYAQPGALPKEALEELLGKVRDIDMAAVQAEIAKAQSDGLPQP